MNNDVLIFPNCCPLSYPTVYTGSALGVAVICPAIEWVPQLCSKHCCLQHDLSRHPRELLCRKRHQEDRDYQHVSTLSEKPCYYLQHVWHVNGYLWSGSL